MLTQDVSLKHLNTWRVGGLAEYFIEPETPEQLADFLQEHVNRFSQITWLGLGSNVLISDQGLSGLVISTAKLNKIYLLPSPDPALHLVYAQAGVPCAKLAKFCSKNQCVGATFFSGIPGTVGGALAMNAGAFGGETWPLVYQVDSLNLEGKIKRKSVNEFTYSYRQVKPDKQGFLAGIFSFQSVKNEDERSLQEKIRALLKKRSETQPIGTFNCGSVFRNPPGNHAAKLIELCGLKDKRIGGAVVSSRHANFIINDDNATADEIYKLIKEVRNTVFQETGVTLITEVKFLGWKEAEN